MRYFVIRLGFTDTEFERMVQIFHEQTGAPRTEIPYILLHQIERELNPNYPGCTVEAKFEVEEKDITAPTVLNVKKRKRKPSKLKPTKVVSIHKKDIRSKESTATSESDTLTP